MKKNFKLLMAALALTALVGCGQSPATAPMKQVSAKKPAAAAQAAPAKAPTLSSKPSAAKPSTAKPAAPKPAPAAPVAEKPGSLKLAVKVSGNAPVASLSLKVFEQADPSVAMDAALTLANGVAGWEQKEVPAGRYTFQVKALDAEGAVLGTGSTEALVKAGAPTEVVLDLRANVLNPNTTETPAPGVGGGTIGLNIEIL